MKRIFYALVCASLFFIADANAQCTGRYVDTNTFAGITKTTVTYSTPYSLQMDIFQPTGDTAPRRPLIVLAHGGAFYSGNKANDITITRLCSLYCRRGYVTASIDYRLASVLDMLDSAAAVNEVIKALSDGKAAIRYFVLDARGANTYRIDTNLIFAGGNSAGAVLYMHLGYITDSTETPDYIDTAFAHNGGFEGDSGNPIPGYRTTVRGVINLAGALNSSSFVNPHDSGSVNAQGDQDDVVPYMCAHALQGTCPVTLCGLGVLEGVYTANSVYHMSIVFPGQGHVPWSNNNTNDPMFYSVDSIVCKFLAEGYVCEALSVPGAKRLAPDVSLFPNPVRDVVNIKASSAMESISLYDATGRLVKEHAGLNNYDYRVTTGNLAPGIYFIKARFVNDDEHMPVIRQLVVQ